MNMHPVQVFIAMVTLIFVLYLMGWKLLAWLLGYHYEKELKKRFNGE